ncbi:MAG: hypothetical protein EOO08_06180 [Chitinophagaceae bacterium]|nr:MAG: hypothetical protein EOO08_06180 [Chitinophagaceae bacterium]
MRTIALLACSNVFMTFAWYYHLKDRGMALWKAILISWGIAFFEYCLTVPANRAGAGEGFNLFELKMIQEVITLIIFCLFAVFVMKQPFHWRYIASFGCLLAAAWFMFQK